MSEKNFRSSRLWFAALLVLFFALEGCAPDDEIGPSDGGRQEYLGTWTCNETSQIHGSSAYVAEITEISGTTNEVFIDNFYNMGGGVKARASIDGNTVTIASQTIAGYNIKGGGTRTAKNTIVFNYTVADIQDSDTVSATYSR